MSAVFLSYSREDRARAEQVAQGLQAAGLNVFWDNEIPPGQTWADYIETKLTQCKALIVLWSEHSTKSQWVREEARLGRDKGVLIPVMMDASAPPFGFGEVQAANLSGWNGDANDPNWRRLVEAVSAFANTDRAPTPRPMEPPRAPTPQPQAWSAPPQSAPPQAKKGVPTWAWIVGAVVATIVVLGVIGNMAEQNQGATPPQQQAAADTTQPMAPPQQQPQQQGGNAAEYQQQVMQRLGQVQQSLQSQGFQAISAPTAGQLNQGQYQNFPVTLTTAGDYRIVGVCDSDCGDLDLVLYDANNNVVSQDNLTDAVPIVEAQLQSPGQFTVQATMHTCNVAPCYFALGLFGRPLQ
ncbi:MAG TPA: TIR domain-containing protein [Vitreimonas sp.]|nr:TIR domain-containing protein [Vitreimonas sp.]